MDPQRARAVSVLAAATLIAVAAPGCRLVQRRGPVPPELATARRLCNEGLAAADRRDLVRAETLLERAVKSCPVDVEARRTYADVLWKRGERFEAVTQISAALRLSPDDAGLCIAAGGMFVELGLLDDADRLARDAVRLAPRSAAAWHLRGQVALARGQAEQALVDLQHGLAFAPDDRGLLRDIVEAYRQLGSHQRMLATLGVLGETYGPNQVPADVLLLEARAQEALGRDTDAAESYRRAVAAGGPPDAAQRLAAVEARLAGGFDTMSAAPLRRE